MGLLQDYSLAIATYNRADSLIICLRLAVTQTRPPNEIIVIDASDDWELTMGRVREELASLAPDIQLQYRPAKVRSLTAQRNEAIALASTGILFMIDDDSFMYRDCAENIMAVYDADLDEAVVGVGARESSASPLDPGPMPRAEPQDRQDIGVVRGTFQRAYWRLHSLMMVERLLLPYDEDYPSHPVPDGVARLNLPSNRYLNGFRMTWRTGPARTILFDDTLQKYAAAEDMDFSYRISRLGLIMEAPRAQLFHAQNPSARLTRYTRALLGMTNLAYLYKRHGHEPADLLQRYKSRVAWRAAVDLVRDLSRGRLAAPYFRADLRAYQFIDTISKIDGADLIGWYQGIQQSILDENRS